MYTSLLAVLFASSVAPRYISSSVDYRVDRKVFALGVEERIRRTEGSIDYDVRVFEFEGEPVQITFIYHDRKNDELCVFLDYGDNGITNFDKVIPWDDSQGNPALFRAQASSIPTRERGDLVMCNGFFNGISGRGRTHDQVQQKLNYHKRRFLQRNK